jgi:hypothetical protein
MRAEYAGRQYVGIDLHRRRSVIVRQTDRGESLENVRIDNDPVALSLEIAKAGTDPEVAPEATYGWHWAADVLQAAGAKVHLAHPLGVKGSTHCRVKNDVRDASDLATCYGWDACPRPTLPRPRSGTCARWSGTAPSASRCAPV